MQKNSTSLTITSALPALFRLSNSSLLLLVPFFSRMEVHRSRLANRLAVLLVAVVLEGTGGLTCANKAGDGGGWANHSDLCPGVLPRTTSGESDPSP